MTTTFLPLLLRPKVLSLRNRWGKGLDLRTQAGRDVFLLFFSLLVVSSLFFGTMWALQKLNEDPRFGFLPPGQFLGLMFMLLQVMLLISSALSTMGVMYFSDDLELILASPVSMYRLLWGKFLYVVFISSWMPFVFAAPVLSAFGVTYHAPIVYYPAALLFLVPYFVIPCAIGFSLGTLLVRIAPLHRVREIVLLVLGLAIVALYSFLYVFRLEWNSLRNAQEILRIVAILAAPNVPWLPSNWLSLSIEELIRPGHVDLALYAGLLVFGALFFSALTYFINIALFDEGYSRSKNRKLVKRYSSAGWRTLRARVGRYIEPRYLAMVIKEMRFLSRDMGQAVQLFMLIGIALTYLYHLRVFSAVESFPESIRPWWKNFLFVGNVAMGAFITTATCTRFVFPSLSLEGRCFWIVQNSPLKIQEVLRIKFWVWFIPVAILSAVFFVSGAYAIGADYRMMLVNGLVSIIVCYGLVGLGIGLGATFAQFDWEHASQLAGGFGNLLYMLFATGLIFLNLIPSWFLLFAERGPLTEFESIVFIGANIIFVFGINVYATRIAMRSGADSIIKRMTA